MRLLQRLRSLSRRRFLRNVAVVAGGNATAQAITTALSPFITRLYGPEAFGVLGVFVAAVAMIAPSATLTYANAIVLPAAESEARSLARLSIAIAGFLSAITLLGVLAWHEGFSRLFGIELEFNYMLLLPFVVFLTAGQRVLSQLLIRYKRFQQVSQAGVAQAAAVGLSKVGVGLVTPTAAVLMILNALGQALHCVLLWAGLPRRRETEAPTSANSSANLDVKPVLSVAREYRDYPLFRAPQVLLNSVSQNIPTVMLAALFGPAAAGFYALARRVLQLPSVLISTSVGTVLLPRMAEEGRLGRSLRPLIIKGTKALALAGLLPFGIVVAFGPWMFTLAFGAEWTTAGVYARWMAVWLYFAFINVPSVQAVPMLGMQGQFLIYEAVLLAVRAGTLAYGALVLQDEVMALIMFSIAGSVLNLLLVTWVISHSHNSLRSSFRAAPELTGEDEEGACL